MKNITVDSMNRVIVNFYFGKEVADRVISGIECEFTANSYTTTIKGTVTFTASMPDSFEEAEKRIMELFK